MYNGVIIVAEVKLWSPRGDRLTQNSWKKQLALAAQVGDIISIHTNPIWRGSFGDIVRARKMTDKPILAKGFHETDEHVHRAVGCGADFVLVVGREPQVHVFKCWVEPLTLQELAAIPRFQWTVWNSRDLSTLKDLSGIPGFLLERWKQSDGTSDRKRESFQEARQARRGMLCQASNLKTVVDIEPGADAVLVGSKLESFAASLGIVL